MEADSKGQAMTPVLLLLAAALTWPLALPLAAGALGWMALFDGAD